MPAEEAEQQFNWIMPMMVDPKAAVANAGIGAALAAGTAALACDLCSVPGLPSAFANQPDPKGFGANPLGHFVHLQAQGGDCYVIFGPTFASVTGANAPAPAAVNTVNGSTGVVTQIVGLCIYLPAGSTLSFKLPRGPGGIQVNGALVPVQGGNSPCRFMGYATAASTATLRVWQSSN